MITWVRSWPVTPHSSILSNRIVWASKAIKMDSPLIMTRLKLWTLRLNSSLRCYQMKPKATWLCAIRQARYDSYLKKTSSILNSTMIMESSLIWNLQWANTSSAMHTTTAQTRFSARSMDPSILSWCLTSIARRWCLGLLKPRALNKANKSSNMPWMSLQ